jgi:hypothetical protein
MKPKKIQWQDDVNVKNEINGIINVLVWFVVRKVGVKNPKFVLLSYPISNPNFTRANNSKVLGEFETPELAQAKAQEIFDEFVNSLIN